MSTIEILAAETTGVRPEDEVIEWALGVYVCSRGKGLIQIDTRIVNPSPKLDWDAGAIAHHQKTGLLPELLVGNGKTKIPIPFAACNARLIWKRGFIAPYLLEHGTMDAAILGSTRCADGVLQLASVLHGARFEKPWRAEQKVRQIAAALDMLGTT